MHRRLRYRLCALLALASAATIFCAPLASAANPRIELRLDSSEAEQVLAILALRQRGKPVGESEWRKLFATEPYQRLKRREEEIGRRFGDPSRAFGDDDFKKFVLSEELLQQMPELRRTLDSWKVVDLRLSAERILRYLPEQAKIRAKVFPTIKPRHNSFVYEPDSDPTIFLYLDPAASAAKFENTVAHELHHIGLSSLGPLYQQKIAGLPENARTAAEWMGAFGEGAAMLAAAGNPDTDPHAASAAEDRARWNHDLANFNPDLGSVNAFFLDVLHRRFATPDALTAKASGYYGVQGPWYTIGYKMAVIVERRFGRPALIETMLDPRLLLARYHQAAHEQNATGKEHLALWSDEVLMQVGAVH